MLTEPHKEVIRSILGIKYDGEVAWQNWLVAREGSTIMPLLNDLLVEDYVKVADNPGGSGHLFRVTGRGRAVVNSLPRR